MRFVYRCSQCGREYAIEPDTMLCFACAPKNSSEQPLHGVLDVALEGEAAEDWRIPDLLPVPAAFFPPLPTGNSPLWQAPRLRRHLNQPHLFLKDDTRLPSGSLKDRASILVAAFARWRQRREICLASTGNAGSSMACVGAAAGLSITLFLPETAPRPKLVQALQYGARLVPVAGNYDLAYELCLQYALKHGVMCRNTAYHPLTIEGKKTVALEIFRQLGRVPDHVFVPTGDGVILSGVYKGFSDLKMLGLSNTMPTIHAVMAEGSDGINRLRCDRPFVPRSTATVADSICVDVPRGGLRARAYLDTYGGDCILVSDKAILEAQHLLASQTGLFAEPAAAAALAGLHQQAIPPGETVVLLITGNGLKDPSAAEVLFKTPQRAITHLSELEIPLEK